MTHTATRRCIALFQHRPKNPQGKEKYLIRTFRDGRLVEWGSTKQGHRLRPVDRVKAGGCSNLSHRSPDRYLKTKATTPSPMRASSLPRNMSDRPVLPPMYDPQSDVEANRELLCKLGVDGSVPFDELPTSATKGDDAVAKGRVS